VAGGVDKDDFAFRVKLVINNVKTRVAIMTVIRTPKIANFCTNIITIISRSTYFLFLYTARHSVHSN
jgi:hypothetical protein